MPHGVAKISAGKRPEPAATNLQPSGSKATAAPAVVAKARALKPKALRKKGKV